MDKPTTISEHHLQEAVRSLFSNHRYVLVNSFVFDWESDLFSVTKTGTVYEVEMKISKADYWRDFEKEKHFFFKHTGAGRIHERDPRERTEWGLNNYDFDFATRKMIVYPYCKSKWHDSTKFFIPNRFYFASPPGVIEARDVPAYAGLIHVKDGHAYQVKQAPFLHKRTLLEAKMLQILLDKFWWLSQRQRYKLMYNGVEFDEGEEQSTNKTL